MNIVLKASVIAATGLILAGCSKSSQQTITTTAPAPALQVGGDVASMPRALVYRTSGDYSANVPVTLNAEGTEIISYPAPTDLSESAMPVDLGDGYWLDRRGINARTAFTSYTYTQYASLTQAPTPAELMKAIIPGARVTMLVQLPISASEAAADPAVCKSYVADNFAGCKVLFRAPSLKM